MLTTGPAKNIKSEESTKEDGEWLPAHLARKKAGQKNVKAKSIQPPVAPAPEVFDHLAQPEIAKTTAAPAPSSPTKGKLLAEAEKRSPPSPRARRIINTGDQCIILEHGHHEVLLVTRYQIAKRFEILKEKFTPIPTDLPFHIPEFVSMNQPLAKLHSPKMNARNESFFKKQYNIYGQLLEENCVYKLPRYDGTLSDLYNLRFKQVTIDSLEETLNRALNMLHENNITHNDLSPKNVFFKGEFPNIQFYLGDFGSITVNTDPKTHEENCRKDRSKLSGIVQQMKRKLEQKEGDPYTPYRNLIYDQHSSTEVVAKQTTYSLRRK